jgi:hypothetical protein
MCIFIKELLNINNKIIINVFYYFHSYVNVKYDVSHPLKTTDVVLNLIYDYVMIENDDVFDDDHH